MGIRFTFTPGGAAANDPRIRQKFDAGVQAVREVDPHGKTEAELVAAMAAAWLAGSGTPMGNPEAVFGPAARTALSLAGRQGHTAEIE